MSISDEASCEGLPFLCTDMRILVDQLPTYDGLVGVTFKETVDSFHDVHQAMAAKTATDDKSDARATPYWTSLVDKYLAQTKGSDVLEFQLKGKFQMETGGYMDRLFQRTPDDEYVLCMANNLKRYRNTVMKRDGFIDCDQAKSHPRLSHALWHHILENEDAVRTSFPKLPKRPVLEQYKTAIHDYIVDPDTIFKTLADTITTDPRSRAILLDKKHKILKTLFNVLAYGGGYANYMTDLVRGYTETPLHFNSPVMCKKIFEWAKEGHNSYRGLIIDGFKDGKWWHDQGAIPKLVRDYSDSIGCLSNILYAPNTELAESLEEYEPKTTRQATFLGRVLRTIESYVNYRVLMLCKQDWIDQFDRVMWMWDGFGLKLKKGKNQDKLLKFINQTLELEFGVDIAKYEIKEPDASEYYVKPVLAKRDREEMEDDGVSKLTDEDGVTMEDSVDYDSEATYHSGDESKPKKAAPKPVPKKKPKKASKKDNGDRPDYNTAIQQFLPNHVYLKNISKFREKYEANEEGLSEWGPPKGWSDFSMDLGQLSYYQKKKNDEGKVVHEKKALMQAWKARQFEDRRDFKTVVFQPRPSEPEPDEFNSFVGLRFDFFNPTFDEERDGKLYRTFMEHISKMIPPKADWDVLKDTYVPVPGVAPTESDYVTTEIDGFHFGKDARCLLDCFAHIIQTPAQKTELMPFLLGIAGCGKSMVFSIFQNVVGRHLCLDGRSNLNNITGRFNADIDGKIVIVVPEPSSKQDPDAVRELINMITCEGSSTESKNIQAGNIKASFHNIFCCINNENQVPGVSEEILRRIAIMYCSDYWLKHPDRDAHFDYLSKFTKLRQKSSTRLPLAYLFKKLLGQPIVTAFPSFSRGRINRDLVEATNWSMCRFYDYIRIKLLKQMNAETAKTKNFEIRANTLFNIFEDWHSAVTSKTPAAQIRAVTENQFRQHFGRVTEKDVWSQRKKNEAGTSVMFKIVDMLALHKELKGDRIPEVREVYPAVNIFEDDGYKFTVVEKFNVAKK